MIIRKRSPGGQTSNGTNHPMERRNTMYPFCLGIDLHLKRNYAVLMDKADRNLEEGRFPNCEIPAFL